MQKHTLFSFGLALALVGGGVFLLNNSMSGFWQPSEDAPASSTNEANSVISIREPVNAALPDQPKRASLDERSAAGGMINKCLIEEKTVYVDQKCPTGATAQEIHLYDTAGVISPPKADLQVLTVQRKAAEAEEHQAGRNQVVTVGASQSKSNQCAFLDRHVEYLDSMARQPQSGSTQDWIRDEKSKTRDRQASLGC
ncbi:hypothetical protein [Noviherbaspirillum sp. Root189]|uniref:hypothetical protein n=1 Tax=Noviherbaspirillum sp. Root189 TaxID=1736487 RepID=UPI00070CA448|nr:hypothetical protein [Noviherbaspirillum sp. Root189]KRB87029.1 hypothetical protein ASE07_20720 [Noviherbaspirillum sp. Root189]